VEVIGAPRLLLLQSHRTVWYIWDSNMNTMRNKNEIWLGTLSLMVLQTLATMGTQHGYGLARRIEQISGDRLQLNYGTLYPALIKLEQDGVIRSEWGVSENNRRAKFYKLTPAGRKHLERETRDWQEASAILSRFLTPAEENR
jgi:PadR family transcriptional regulator PadR